MMEEDRMAGASWKNKMTERWKTRFPHILKDDLTLERLVIPRPITEVVKEDIYFTITIEIEGVLGNQATNRKYLQSKTRLSK